MCIVANDFLALFLQHELSIALFEFKLFEYQKWFLRATLF